MDKLQALLYSQQFTVKFHTSKATAFQQFFEALMLRAYRGDFSPVKPHGNIGDLKCDGFRHSDGVVFQCYAPKDFKLAELQKKIKEDYDGAAKHWAGRMKKWCFVHNEADGLPAPVVQQIDDMRKGTDGIDIEVWSYVELKELLTRMTLQDHEDVFGLTPSLAQFDRLSFSQLEPVIKTLATAEPAIGQNLIPPSAEKLSANALSEEVAALLRLGRRKEQLVKKFFDDWPQPELGESIAEAFRERYRALHTVGMKADDIFSHLQNFSGGMTGNPQHQGAVLAVLSYFFERCDIFEDVSKQSA
jgi:hypothetical protein